ncbi:MAG: Glycerol 3-phosphate-binding protein, partial [Burkholderia sp.]|nr:Glycerol 3-phosphate-binding protein [Burkholderia sp.]
IAHTFNISYILASFQAGKSCRHEDGDGRCSNRSAQEYRLEISMSLRPKGALRRRPERDGIWSGKKTAKEALDAAVKRGDEQLVRFEKANR